MPKLHETIKRRAGHKPASTAQVEQDLAYRPIDRWETEDVGGGFVRETCYNGRMKVVVRVRRANK